MVNASSTPTIEAFLTDDAFFNTAVPLLTLFQDGGGQVASLNYKVLSYFNTPFVWEDKRTPASRDVNWAATSSPKILVDQANFPFFVTEASALSESAQAGVFKLIDKLLLDYAFQLSKAEVEAFLAADSQIKSVYVAGSFTLSTVIATDTVYLANSTQQVSAPAWAEFSLRLPQGAGTTDVVMRVYASVDQWIQNYSVSTISKIIPPLPYEQILFASITAANDNIFATASVTASLNYTTTNTLLGNTSVSGIVRYMATITDGINKTQIPFNILYKGRKPTMYEIRTAMKNALLTSGVGNEELWKKRMPGVFIDGRFYVLPLWDQTLTKADQTIFPNVLKYKTLEILTERIMASLGYGDLTTYMDILPCYYDRMTATAIPDLSGTVMISHLTDFIPDYQSHSPNSEQFQYMEMRTQAFAREVNTILSISSGQARDDNYILNEEGELSFYSFTLDSYEICVISLQCYTSIMERTV